MQVAVGCERRSLHSRRPWIALYVFVLLTQPTRLRADVITLFNHTPVLIPATGTIGDGAPYPSQITFSGLTSPVADITATIYGLSHTSISDIGMLLVGPGGQSVVLMDFVGSGAVANAQYTFDDAAPNHLPFTGIPPSGTYKPTAYDFSGDLVSQFDTFDPPAPSSGYSTSGLSVFDGLDANGTYSLYVEDFSLFDSGVLTNGWSLTIATVPEPDPVLMTFLVLGLAWIGRRCRAH